MRVCDCCKANFTLVIKGSGGSNRRFCYDCLPDGLSRIERNQRRTQIMVRMSREHKVSLGCRECGYAKFGGALEWHHPDGDKDHDPADAIGISWERYLKEAAKCILLCANCHREAHAGISECSSTR
jgi:hypothetical protein